MININFCSFVLTGVTAILYRFFKIGEIWPQYLLKPATADMGLESCFYPFYSLIEIL